MKSLDSSHKMPMCGCQYMTILSGLVAFRCGAGNDEEAKRYAQKLNQLSR